MMSSVIFSNQCLLVNTSSLELSRFIEYPFVITLVMRYLSISDLANFDLTCRRHRELTDGIWKVLSQKNGYCQWAAHQKELYKNRSNYCLTAALVNYLILKQTLIRHDAVNPFQQSSIQRPPSYDSHDSYDSYEDGVLWGRHNSIEDKSPPTPNKIKKEFISRMQKKFGNLEEKYPSLYDFLQLDLKKLRGKNKPSSQKQLRKKLTLSLIEGKQTKQCWTAELLLKGLSYFPTTQEKEFKRCYLCIKKAIKREATVAGLLTHQFLAASSNREWNENLAFLAAKQGHYRHLDLLLASYPSEKIQSYFIGKNLPSFINFSPFPPLQIKNKLPLLSLVRFCEGKCYLPSLLLVMATLHLLQADELMSGNSINLDSQVLANAHYSETELFIDEALVKYGNQVPSNALIFAGDIKYRRGKMPEAERIYKKVIEFYGYDLNVLKSYTRCLFGQGKYEKAEESYKKIHDMYGEDSIRLKDWNNYAICLLRQGKYIEAEKNCEKAIKIYGSQVSKELLHFYTDCLLEQGKYEEATKNFQRVVKIYQIEKNKF